MGNKKRKEQGSLEKVAQKKSKMVEAAAKDMVAKDATLMELEMS